ncbi:hypothetical protein EPN28_01315 [Patescibacteria group bacterium]|nr:MAG: hypothetical protein EPN28_01315 [Patescibacteria group bacterium]
MGKSYEEVWRGLTGGQQEALQRKLWLAAGGQDTGEEGLATILRDEQKITLVDAIVKLADKRGRCIPIPGMRGRVVDANRNFRLGHLEISTVGILYNLRQFFAPEMKFPSEAEFARRVADLIALAEKDKQTKNLLKGAYWPLCFPQLAVVDYGRSLEEIFLPAVKRSYEAAFPGRNFKNYRADELVEQVTVAAGTRHEMLLAKMAEGPVVGLWFANPLQGFGIHADREQIAAFPESFILSGAIDTATAMVADPQTLCRSYKTPSYVCAANVWYHNSSPYFRADDDKLYFSVGVIDASDFSSGGLLFLG